MDRNTADDPGEQGIGSRRRRRIGWLAIVLCMLAGISVGVFVLLVSPRRRIESKVSRVRADLRNLATAIEAFYVDHNVYPASAAGRPDAGNVHSFNWKVAEAGLSRSGVADLPSFAVPELPVDKGGFQTLLRSIASAGMRRLPNPAATTITVYTAGGGRVVKIGDEFGYLDAYPVDPFCKDPGATYVYWNVMPGYPQPAEAPVGGIGWMLVSPGPDGDYDIAGSYDVYDPSKYVIPPRLLAGTNARGSAFTYDPTNGLVSDGDIWRVKQ